MSQVYWLDVLDPMSNGDFHRTVSSREVNLICEAAFQEGSDRRLPDRYFLHAGYFAENGAAYTRFSLTRPFESLPGCFVECIETMEREFSAHPP
jgi:hypothetical protein